MSKEYDEYAELAKNGTLPADFDQWELAAPTGITVAHEAALWGNLPADFSQWGLAANDRWTVAHTAAREGHLPADFNQWTLADKNGRTVAHVAARFRHLPDNFDQWGLSNDKGRTVLECLLPFSVSADPDPHMSRWGKERPLCKTDADWEIFKKELPEIYQKYTVSECMLDIDSDQEALQGALL
jgi:hypothetical protein